MKNIDVAVDLDSIYDEMSDAMNEVVRSLNNMTSDTTDDYGASNYRALNDMMIDWCENFADKAEDTTEEERLKITERITEIKAIYISQDYIDDLKRYINDMNLSFLDKKTKVDKMSNRFNRFLDVTCRKLCLDKDMYENLITPYIEHACGGDTSEVKVFEAILYKLTLSPLIIGKLRYRQRFLNLFLQSMEHYSFQVFNSIVNKYHSYTEDEK